MCRTAITPQWARTGALLVSLLLLHTLTNQAAAQPAAAVGFDPPFISVLNAPCSEDTFSVSVVIGDTPTPVQGFTFVFKFDPAVIEPVQVLEGSLLGGSPFPTFFVWLNAAAIGDSVQIDAAVLGGTFTGPGELAQIRFQKLYPTTTALTWTGLDFRDNQNLSIPVEGTSGFVEILPCPVPAQPSTWGRLKRAPALVERRPEP